MLNQLERAISLIGGILFSYAGVKGIEYWWGVYNTPLGVLTSFIINWSQFVGGMSIILFIAAIFLFYIAYEGRK